MSNFTQPHVSIDYKELIADVLSAIEKNSVQLDAPVWLKRSQRGIITDYSFQDNKSYEKTTVREFLREIYYKDNFIGMITLKDWCFINSFSLETATRMAELEILKSADWDEREKQWYIDGMEKILK